MIEGVIGELNPGRNFRSVPEIGGDSTRMSATHC